MKLIVGLGNPGDRYSETRHNVGFRILARFAEKYRIAFDGHEKDAFTGKGRVAGRAVMLAKPQTHMNLSGRAVAGLVRARLDDPSDLIVVYDDIDLPIGGIRIRQAGSAGTHNGMKSVIEELGTDQFPRLRFGIRPVEGRGGGDLADFVLDRFEPEEDDTVTRGVNRAIDALLFFVRDDLRRAMSEFNRDPVEEASVAQ